MNNYIELKEKIERLNLEIKELENKNNDIIETLKEAKEKYKKEFRVLPLEITKENIKKLPLRLEILEEEFEESNLDESTKQRIINTLNKMKQELEQNINKLEILNKEKEEANKNLKEREKQLKEKEQKLEQNKQSAEKLNYDKKISLYQAIINNDEIDFRVKEEAKLIIDNLIKEKEKLAKEKEEILENNQEIDELSMFRLDKYQKNQPKLEEQSKEEIQNKNSNLELLEINKPWTMFSVTESENNKPLLYVKENKDYKDLLTEEEEQEVINVKPAKEKLIKFLNKNQFRIGVLLMSIAVITVLAEPVSLLAIPAIPAVKTVNKEIKKLLKK